MEREELTGLFASEQAMFMANTLLSNNPEALNEVTALAKHPTFYGRTEAAIPFLATLGKLYGIDLEQAYSNRDLALGIDEC